MTPDTLHDREREFWRGYEINKAKPAPAPRPGYSFLSYTPPKLTREEANLMELVV